jgi:PLP dependent protein
VSDIADRLREVELRLRQAEERHGRAPGSVKLIAVSKMHPSTAIREAYEAGHRDFGENYVQELATKVEELSDLPELRFHLIGNIQTNKAKLAAKLAHVVHTVDDVHIARELGKRALALGKHIPVLIEVNVGGEGQKHGAAPSDLSDVIAAVRREEALELRGLMTVPPHTEDPEGARPFFSTLRTLASLHGGKDVLPELSMGMTHDMEIAVSEGATMVRIGTAIFGARG